MLLVLFTNAPGFDWILFLTSCLFFPRHPTSCCSAAELMSVLFFHTMRYKADDPRNQCNDRFVLSKVGAFVSFRLYLCFGWKAHLQIFVSLFRVMLHPSCMLPGWRQVM